MPAAVPLTLLEAIRNLDTPVNDGLELMSPELIGKRLGLSATVQAQIARYTDQLERGETVSRDEAASVFRLVGRRPDAPLVFADGGRRVARRAMAGRRRVGRMAPGPIARRLQRRAARLLARQTLDVELGFPAGTPEASAAEPLSITAWPDGAACAYYASALAELLRLTTGFEGIMRHVACRGRGDAECRWQGMTGEDDA